MTLTSLFAAQPPTVAVQIAARVVSAIAVTRPAGGTVISGHAIEPLQAGVVTPALTGQNVSDAAALGEAVGRVLSRLGGRTRRVALVLPDSIAKVSLIRLETVPPREEDLDQLIRWHVRKTAPFHIDEAQVTYSPGIAVPGGGREFVVALARRDVVKAYEDACEVAGAQAGLVDLATFSVVNAVLAGEAGSSGDWLLVNVTPEYGSIAILRGADLIFFRNRAEGSEDTLPDLVHQTAMYYEDRLGGSGFARVLVTGSGADGWASGATAGLEATRRLIDTRLNVKTETVDPQRSARFADRIAADPALLNIVTPLVGVLARAGAGV
ncbi:MAG TPA: pilus assembly protein PilM [Vicinamibacterales bacterium]|jgi:Tfp pilus assembly PilM family ATPase